MSDFRKLNPVLLKRGGTVRYLVKYIVKTEDKIVYSRGVPAEIYKEVGDEEIVAEYFDFVPKYVFFDDVLDYDLERDTA